MPGKTQAQAYDSYADPLKRVLGCITTAHIRIPKGKGYGTKESPIVFAFTENPAPLNASPYCLHFTQWFYVGQSNDRDRFKVHTAGYFYAILNSSDRQEVLSFHWQPMQTEPRPHIHIGFATKALNPPFNPKAHIPSGRVPVEDIVDFLIKEMAVPPLKDGWERIIAGARQAFMQYKSW